MICVGDIVAISAAHERELGPYLLFADGFFFVLKVMSSNVKIQGKTKNIQSCKIMNNSGMTSWIDSHSLIVILKLNNE